MAAEEAWWRRSARVAAGVPVLFLCAVFLAVSRRTTALALPLAGAEPLGPIALPRASSRCSSSARLSLSTSTLVPARSTSCVHDTATI